MKTMSITSYIISSGNNSTIKNVVERIKELQCRIIIYAYKSNKDVISLLSDYNLDIRTINDDKPLYEVKNEIIEDARTAQYDYIGIFNDNEYVRYIEDFEGFMKIQKSKKIDLILSRYIDAPNSYMEKTIAFFNPNIKISFDSDEHVVMKETTIATAKPIMIMQRLSYIETLTPIEPQRKKVALCCIGKNEKLYIADYVKHYKSIGFTNVIFHDNNNVGDDSQKEALKPYIDEGFVIYKDCRGMKSYQIRCYEKCYSDYHNDYDYMCFYDCDEYLVMDDKFKNISDLLDIYGDANAIYFNWRMMDDNDLLRYERKPVIERFTRGVDNADNKHIKAMLKCTLVPPIRFANPHNIRRCGSEVKCVYSDGSRGISSSPFHTPPSYANAYIKHFYSLTAQEFAMRRLNRGNADSGIKHTKEDIANQFFHINKKTEEKQKMIDYVSTMNNICFIIPNRGGVHIDYVIRRLKEFYPNSEYLIITQDDDKPFMRGQLFNIGFNYTSCEYLCLFDNDMFFKTYVDLIGEYTKQNAVLLQPFMNICQCKLNEDGTYTQTSSRRKASSQKGGVSFISRKNFIKVNGMSNMYIGYGYEDNEFDSRCGGIKSCNADIMHISHVTNATPQFNTRKYPNRVLFEQRRNRSVQKDGYNETLYDVISDEMLDIDIREVKVNNIRMKDDFEYQKYLMKYMEIMI